MSCHCHLGLSARAIASAGGGHRDYPHDPSDLLRCINYCRSAGITTEALQTRMAGVSPEWSALVAEWDNLVALLNHEMATRTDGRASRTYREMQRLIYGGLPCTACDSTGRGTECVKCKGTGRRSGGRCRARGCWQGADFCSECRGRGYLLPVAVAS